MNNLFRFAAGLASGNAAVLEPIDTLDITSSSAPAAHASAPEIQVSDAVFEALVASHYRRIYSIVYRMVRNEADAADLTQETFVRAYRAMSRLREEGAQSAWLRRIATNLCLDFLRRRNASPAMSSLDARPSEDSDTLLSWDIADPTGEPDRLFHNKERMAMLNKAVQSLPDGYRTVIVMHHIEEMRVEEIAELLGVPGGTIKSRLSRARRELHRKLSPYFDPDLAPR